MYAYGRTQGAKIAENRAEKIGRKFAENPRRSALMCAISLNFKMSRRSAINLMVEIMYHFKIDANRNLIETLYQIRAFWRV